MNLREDKHWSYGAGTAFQFARGDSAWVTRAPVQTDKTKESLVELDKELREVFGARPISQDELNKDKDNRTLRLAGSRETMAEVGDAIEHIVEYHLPDDYYSAYVSKGRALEPNDLRTAGNAVLNAVLLVWVAGGD